eukprot:365645-Chlamydomonas_euryale.AAC.10
MALGSAVTRGPGLCRKPGCMGDAAKAPQCQARSASGSSHQALHAFTRPSVANMPSFAGQARSSCSHAAADRQAATGASARRATVAFRHGVRRQQWVVYPRLQATHAAVQR